MMIAYNLPHAIGLAAKFDFSLPIDGKIPLVPAFTYVYILAFAYWGLSYIYISTFSRAFAQRIFLADLLGKIVSFACFLIFPITIARPAVEEITGAGAWLIKIVYAVDKPGNLFPSLHCFVSYLCARALFSRNAPRTKTPVLVASVVFSLLVCLSTLFTRQHLVADVISGIALGEIAWLVSGVIIRRFSGKISEPKP